MAYIDKTPVQTIKTDNEKQQMRRKFYNSTQWRNLRAIYRQSHPLCEDCLADNIINGEDIQIHHILSPFDAGLDEMERWRRLLDYSNLRALCPKCHSKTHNVKREKKIKKVDYILDF